MEMYKWIDAHKNKYLRVSEVALWKPGHTVEVCVLDEHFEEDYIRSKLRPNYEYVPQVFFGGNHALLTYHGDFKWTFKNNAGELDHFVHLGIRKNSKYMWDAIDSQGLTKKVKCLCADIDCVCDRKKNKQGVHWTSVLNARAGCYGPIIKWDDINGNVFYTN